MALINRKLLALDSLVLTNKPEDTSVPNVPQLNLSVDPWGSYNSGTDCDQFSNPKVSDNLDFSVKTIKEADSNKQCGLPTASGNRLSKA